MRVKSVVWLAGLLATSCLGFALPAAADITVVSRYTLVNGDTLTRASYYTPRRTRVTAPDGKEFMYDSKTKTLTVINHAKRIYWSGPMARADSIADSILTVSRKQLADIAAADQAAWMAKVQGFNDSIRVTQTDATRKIANYETTAWTVTAGSYMQHERWVARALAVSNYGPELQKVVMASIMDPYGRQLMKLLISARATSGLPLASRTTFHTPTQSGSFDFEAVQVIGQPVPETAWAIPDGYTLIKL